ncbi:FliH/SctL family protein [Paenibacillus bovis]|uniref:Flagellar assembly protein FliH n=1 Tax=Paenibacillus bovis TaxID=1616788 RepID=A0A172ZFY9_9BACL|nr:FliH/SctL family protein [Paenibacillus bovis]ANF96518.1 flagellar assembly protein FliH [Paenibacillus bovis]
MSNLIKSSQYIPVEILKKLDLSKDHFRPTDLAAGANQQIPHIVYDQPRIDEQTVLLKEQMLADAREFAERQVREAAEEAERILQNAQEMIASWWDERREQDEHLIEAVKAQAFQEGYEEGQQRAETEMQQRINEMMQEAQTVLSQAYEAKEQIIQEAEPFLVNLSCGIAEKVIDRELADQQELVLSLIKKTLARKREQGLITLCVNPSQFDFIHAAREELVLAIDSQAELQILPDATVRDRGCVIRSAFGSVDARVDTQLAELKKELLRLALHDEERGNANV